MFTAPVLLVPHCPAPSHHQSILRFAEIDLTPRQEHRLLRSVDKDQSGSLNKDELTELFMMGDALLEKALAAQRTGIHVDDEFLANIAAGERQTLVVVFGQ